MSDVKLTKAQRRVLVCIDRYEHRVLAGTLARELDLPVRVVRGVLGGLLKSGLVGCDAPAARGEAALWCWSRAGRAALDA